MLYFFVRISNPFALPLSLIVSPALSISATSIGCIGLFTFNFFGYMKYAAFRSSADLSIFLGNA